MTDKCILCRLDAEFCGHVGDADVTRYQCARCGQFDITGSADSVMSMIADVDRTLICDWINEQNSFGSRPVIKSNDLQALLIRRRIGWTERSERLLQALVRARVKPGNYLDVLDPKFSGRLQTFDHDEILWTAKLLADEGFVAGIGDSGMVAVLPKGYVRCDELRTATSASLQGFVAMWFNPKTDDAWLNGFSPAIRDAGYDPFRIDLKQHTNKICDEIVAEIRGSRFVVADFTGQRGGVYFEAGFAMGLGLPVVWTCHEKDISELHFDIRQYNCVLWQTPADLATKLNVRIRAVIGQGGGVPGP